MTSSESTTGIDYEPIAFSRLGGEPELYSCARCNVVFSGLVVGISVAYDLAKKHCMPKICMDCSGPVEKGWLSCGPCREHNDAERLAKKFEDATKLTEAEWDGPIHVPGMHEDGYFGSIDDLRELFNDNECELPVYVNTCKTIKFAIDIGQVLEWTDERLERSEDTDLTGLVDVKELEAFIDAWNAKQTVAVWQFDESRAVVLDT